MGSSRSEMQCPEFESPMDHHLILRDAGVAEWQTR